MRKKLQVTQKKCILFFFKTQLKIIQQTFDYARKWERYYKLFKKKCIRFCLKLNSRQHLGAKEFKEINWLPTPQTEYNNTSLHPLDWNSPCRGEGASHQEVSTQVRQREDLNWATQLKSPDQQIFSTMSSTDSTLISQRLERPSLVEAPLSV